MIDCSGVPARWPEQARTLWAACLARASATHDLSASAPPRGVPELRAVLADVLGCEPDAVRVTGGVRSAASALAAWSAGISRRIEAPTFADVPRLFGTARTNGSRALHWVTTPCRNPDGHTLDEADCARMRDLALAGDTVVVNEIYRWFRLEAPRVASATRVGSLAKVGGGGLRIGWVLDAPDDDVLGSMLDAAMAPQTWQHAAADFLVRRGLDLLRPAFVVGPQAAAAAFRSELPSDLVPVPGDSAAPHLLLPVECEKCAVTGLAAHGLRVNRGRAFHAPRPSVRFCFTGVDPGQAADAAWLVARWWRSRGPCGCGPRRRSPSSPPSAALDAGTGAERRRRL